jgi:hypothetical protein
MHATQPQGRACPDTRTDTTADRFVALLGDPEAFRLNIARQMAAVNQPATPEHTDGEDDGYVVTDAGIRALTDTIGQSETPGTAASVLRSAALYLERHGWIQGSYYDDTAQVFTPAACTVGAIAMVCYGGPVDAPAQHFDDPGYLDFEEAVLHLDRYLLVEDGTEAYEFNDVRGRAAADVIRVLRQAADTPADELIDALRAIDAKNADVAAIAELLKPSGIWAGQACTTDGGDDA